jgi:hypothetical protein
MSKRKQVEAVSENVEGSTVEGESLAAPQLSAEELAQLKRLVDMRASKREKNREKRANRTEEQKEAAKARHKKYAARKRENDRALIAKAKAAGFTI